MKTLVRGTDRLYRTTDKTFYVVQCPKCGMMRLYPWPSPAELVQYYPSDYWFDAGADPSGSLAESYRRLVLADHVRFVWRALKDSGIQGPVLDIGCGGGLFLRMLAERGAKVAGLDFAFSAARVALRTNNVSAVCASLARSPLANESCAAVTMFHVLEHLSEPGLYLEEARAALKPGGRLIVQVPNADCWQFLLFGEYWNGVDIPRHLFHFRAKDLHRLLEDCGFEVLRQKHFSWRDNPAGLATTLMPSLDPMSRRIRGVKETRRTTLLKDLTYFGLVLASWPFTVLEALCRQGSTIMMEARRKP
jgi:SAM-dependent methyltransferase